MFKRYILTMVLASMTFAAVMAQKPTTTNPSEKAPSGPAFSPSTAALPSSDSVTVTVILKHQQEKNLTEIRRKLESNGFWDLFPPKDARVQSWNIVMGYGQIITLRLPVSAVRALNLAIQNGAWGAYDTEIYLTYDYMEIWKNFLEKREESKEDKD